MPNHLNVSDWAYLYHCFSILYYYGTLPVFRLNALSVSPKRSECFA